MEGVESDWSGGGGGGAYVLEGGSLERRGSIRTGLGYDCCAGKF